MTSRGAGPAVPAPILFVHSGLDWITGSERCLLDLVARLDRARYAPLVLCNTPTLADAARQLGVPVYQSPGWGESAERFVPSAPLRREPRDIVQRHGVRLIHANDLDPMRVLVPVARSAGIPLLSHLHIIPDAAERRWSLLHQVSLAVGVSRAAIRGLEDDGFPPERATVIYNGVDPERLGRGDRRALRAELGIAPDDIVFTIAGSLIPRKGIDLALRAFSLLGARRSGCHLLICGDGPAGDDLRALAVAQGVAERVHFLGRRQDVGAVLRDATDVLVSSAREESFGLTVAEAWVFGIPTITSAIEAHVEVTDQGRSGLLFPPGDVAALADAMQALAGDPARRRELGEIGRARAQAEFHIDRYVARFDDAYAGLLGRPRRAYGWIGGSRWSPVYRDWVIGAVRRRLR